MERLAFNFKRAVLRLKRNVYRRELRAIVVVDSGVRGAAVAAADDDDDDKRVHNDDGDALIRQIMSIRPGSNAVLYMSRIECKCAKTMRCANLHSIRLM